MSSAPQDTCWTVLRAASRGDAEARSTFADSYATPIRTYLVHRWGRCGLASEIDDAVQDVFVECVKPEGVLQRANPDRGDFRGLLYGVARNVARRYEERAAQRGQRRPGESVYLDELPAQEQALSRVFDRAWARSLLQEALLRHAAAARHGNREDRRRYRILRLRHARGLPVREIAAALEEPDIDKVHNEYRRARREFGGTLREIVAAHTGARGTTIDAECRLLIEFLGT